jgi:hypothetical protein
VGWPGGPIPSGFWPESCSCLSFAAAPGARTAEETPWTISGFTEFRFVFDKSEFNFPDFASWKLIDGFDATGLSDVSFVKM